MYLRRKCYSSLYDDLYNDYLYDKYFSDLDDYDYYDQREFAMSPAEMAKLMYRTERNLMGKGAGFDKLAQKQKAKLENILYKDKDFDNPRDLSKYSDFLTRSLAKTGGVDGTRHIDHLVNRDKKWRINSLTGKFME